jgi:hypothetical protein
VKGLRLAGAVLAFVVAPAPLIGSESPSALEIALQVEHVNRFRSLRNVSYGTDARPLVVVDRPRGEDPRVNTLQRFRNNDYNDGVTAARDLVIFRGGKARGTAILVTDPADTRQGSSYILWLPSIRKIRRIAEPHPADNWSGSNLTYGDIYLRRARDEGHRLLGIEPFPACLGTMEVPAEQRGRHVRQLPPRRCDLQGRPVYKLESRPLNLDAGYDRRLVWVDAEGFADYRSEFYREGRLFKTIDKDWRAMGLDDPLAQYWVHWYAVTHSDGHEGMAFIDPAAISWNDDLDPRLWSEARLRRIRR